MQKSRWKFQVINLNKMPVKRTQDLTQVLLAKVIFILSSSVVKITEMQNRIRIERKTVHCSGCHVVGHLVICYIGSV